MVYKPLHPCQNKFVSFRALRSLAMPSTIDCFNPLGKVMGIEVELLIAAADILLALLVAVSLPAREEIT